MKRLALWFLLVVSPLFAVAQHSTTIQYEQDLRGRWLFATGDHADWRFPATDDAEWQSIFVPSFWENEGHHDYNGYAWYRLHFTPAAELEGKVHYLNLGYIDDVDETFLNGVLIGSTGQMPHPNGDFYPAEAYRTERMYRIPAQTLKFGEENVLAIRVFDGLVDGGLYAGKPALIGADNPVTNVTTHATQHNLPDQPGFWSKLWNLAIDIWNFLF